MPNCIEGYYFDGNNSTCRLCPAQYFCPLAESNLSNYTQYCARGYYRSGSDCVACPDGIECPGGKPADMTCSDGLYLWDDGRCMSYQYGDPGTAPNCNPGYYNNGGTCTACTANSTCTSASEFICNAGYYKNGNACGACPTNSYCPLGTTQIKCDDGYYLSGQNCYRCGLDAYCKDNIRYLCPSTDKNNFDPPFAENERIVLATYNAGAGDTSDISACGFWRIQLETDFDRYEFCSKIGRWNGEKYPRLTTTPNLWVSTTMPGYYLQGETIACGINGYKYKLSCTNGPAHSTYTGAGTPNGNDCPWQCDDGYYRDGDTCAVCPDGMNCLGGTIVCPAGQYPDVSVCRTCTNKPEHSAYTGPGTPAGNDCAFTCDAGYYYDGTACAICEPGYYCPGDNERHACDGNGYSDITGATVCKSCPVATNLNPDDVKGYYHYAPDGGLHTNIRNCYVKFKVPKTINHGTLTAYLCYIDSNLETYGVSSLCQTQYPNVKCDGGYYMNLPNMSDYYLNINGLDNFLPNICIPVGEKYYSPDNDWQRYECPGRQTTTGSGVGADQAEDCGVIWHIGGQEVRLRSERRTDPRFCVQINDDVFYADMTPVSEGAHGNIRIEVNGIVYSVYNADLQ